MKQAFSIIILLFCCSISFAQIDKTNLLKEETILALIEVVELQEKRIQELEKERGIIDETLIEKVMNAYTVKEMKDKLKKAGVAGYSRLNKKELAELIISSGLLDKKIE